MMLRLAILMLALVGASLAPSGAATGQTGDAAVETAQTAAVGSEAVTDATPQPTLEELLWVARPLVVFADTPNDPRFQQQRSFLEERTGELEERGVRILFDSDPNAEGPLRKELRPRGFGVVLVDKDGSVVKRLPNPTTSREILNLIDRLPSWRQESGSMRQ